MRRDEGRKLRRICQISIHAPHAGCDSYEQIAKTYSVAFQSTHPMRGATRDVVRLIKKQNDFNPRTPCGVRPAARKKAEARYFISIHAPHAGCDEAAERFRTAWEQFQSTHPMRGATIPYDSHHVLRGISIHAPHAGCDHIVDMDGREYCEISIHAPHAGCDPVSFEGVTGSPSKRFQSTHPMRGATFHLSKAIWITSNFNPRTPCGVRQYGKNLSILPQVSASFPRSGKSALYLSGI